MKSSLRAVSLAGLVGVLMGLALAACPFGPSTLNVLHFACKTDPDCAPEQKCVIDNFVMQTGHCQSKSCLNETLDEGETDTDCGGGLCSRCADLAKCKGNGDCRSGRCVLAQDGFQRCMGNPADAGATGAIDGESCVGDDDCKGKHCNGGTCVCGDGEQNWLETGIDCGRFCPQQCGLGSGCEENSDCVSGFCEGGSCAPVPDGGVLANCGDGQQNGDETDTDCGGSTCDPCPDMKVCLGDDDCASVVCDYLGDTKRCVPPATFRVVSGTLTITACDCGGQTAPCGAAACMGDEVCDGQFCRAGCDVANQDCPMPTGFKCDKGACVPDGTSTCNGADFGFFCAATPSDDAGTRPKWGFSTCDTNQSLVCTALP